MSDYDFKVKNGLQVNGSISVNSTALYINNIPISANGSIGLAGEVFYSNGTSNYWASLPSVTPPGSNTQVIFNDADSSNAVAGFTFNKTTNTVSIGGATINSTFFSKQSNTALTANNSSYAYGKNENALNVNSSTYSTNAVNSNNSTYAYGKTEANLNANSAKTSNNSTYAYGKTEANLNVNSASVANNSVYFSGQSIGTSANNVVQLDTSARLPAVDGSQLTNVNAVSKDNGAQAIGTFAISGNTAKVLTSNSTYSGSDLKLGAGTWRATSNSGVVTDTDTYPGASKSGGAYSYTTNYYISVVQRIS